MGPNRWGRSVIGTSASDEREAGQDSIPEGFAPCYPRHTCLGSVPELSCIEIDQTLRRRLKVDRASPEKDFAGAFRVGSSIRPESASGIKLE
jgi:hypothetical protein